LSFQFVKRTPVHPINPWIRNTFSGDFYLKLVRSGRFRRFRRLLENLLCTEIACPVPERLYIPHPYGIVAGSTSKIGENVTLMQFSLLGPRDPWYQGTSLEKIYPALEEGVYVSAGAKVLGPITIGAWSAIGANAVVTEDIPAFSTVVGTNRILRTTEGGDPPIKRYLESRKRAD
jgi:serine acetyltransferase